MAYKGREIEVKLQVKGVRGMATVERLLAGLTKRAKRVIRGRSDDTYFRPPAGAKADFVRLRRPNKDDVAKLTIKYTDRASTVDRVEKESTVEYKHMLGILLDLFGNPAGSIDKRYTVLFMGGTGTEADTAISIYQIVGDPRVFVEVEAKTHAKMMHWYRAVQRALPFELVPQNQSLYSLFVEKTTGQKARTGQGT